MKKIIVIISAIFLLIAFAPLVNVEQKNSVNKKTEIIEILQDSNSDKKWRRKFDEFYENSFTRSAISECFTATDYYQIEFSTQPESIIEYSILQASSEGKSDQVSAWLKGEDVREVANRLFGIKNIDLSMHELYNLEKDGFFIEGASGTWRLEYEYVRAEKMNDGKVVLIAENKGCPKGHFKENCQSNIANSNREITLYIFLERTRGENAFYFEGCLVKPKTDF